MILIILLLIPVSTYAYLDPGTGSLIIHLIVGAVIGATYSVRIFWSNIKAFGARIFGRKKDISNSKNVTDKGNI
jgi:hypothetical protein